MRREWIEIINQFATDFLRKSPSMRREWIEMIGCSVWHLRSATSPSMRREWIEIKKQNREEKENESLPPCGGSGLKYRRWSVGYGI